MESEVRRLLERIKTIKAAFAAIRHKNEPRYKVDVIVNHSVSTSQASKSKEHNHNKIKGFNSVLDSDEEDTNKYKDISNIDAEDEAYQSKKNQNNHIKKGNKESCNEVSKHYCIKHPLEPLDAKEKMIIDFVLRKKNSDEILIEHPKIGEKITGHALTVLKPGGWLNDEIINPYLVMLKEREKTNPEKFLKCHFFNSFFYPTLQRDLGSKKFRSTMRQTRKLDYKLIDCAKVFVPINRSSHWSLVVVDMEKKKIQYLDSLARSDEIAFRIMGKIEWYIKQEAKQRSNINLEHVSWIKEFPEDIPKQDNSDDCGIFMLKFIDFLSRGLPINFNQIHMVHFRLRIIVELLNIPGFSYRATELT